MPFSRTTQNTPVIPSPGKPSLIVPLWGILRDWVSVLFGGCAECVFILVFLAAQLKNIPAIEGFVVAVKFPSIIRNASSERQSQKANGVGIYLFVAVSLDLLLWCLVSLLGDEEGHKQGKASFLLSLPLCHVPFPHHTPSLSHTLSSYSLSTSLFLTHFLSLSPSYCICGCVVMEGWALWQSQRDRRIRAERTGFTMIV